VSAKKKGVCREKLVFFNHAFSLQQRHPPLHVAGLSSSGN
jgi:hypothetical protein